MNGRRATRRTRRDGWGDAKHDPDLRVVCNPPSHGRAVVATFRRPVGGDLPAWYWDEVLGYGGGPVTWNREREWEHPRPAQDGREAVRDLQRLPDVLSCRQCGLRLTVNRDDFNEWLERLHKAGVSEVGLPALVAIMTKRSST